MITIRNGIKAEGTRSHFGGADASDGPQDCWQRFRWDLSCLVRVKTLIMDSFIRDFLVQKEKCKAFGGGQGSSFIRRWKYSYFRGTANSLTFTSCCILASDLACERSAAPHPRANKISALQKNAALLPTVHKQRSSAGFWDSLTRTSWLFPSFDSM